MAFFDRSGRSMLLRGFALAGVIAAAWAIERRPPELMAGEMLAGAEKAGDKPTPGPFRILWEQWPQVLRTTYRESGEDRLLAVAAGVVFYALLAIFPAITAFVSFYGLIASYQAIDQHIALLSHLLPAGGVEIVQEQIGRIVARSDGKLSFAFVGGVCLALWSANAGIKAMMDALNVIEGEAERRGFFRLNAASLSFTFGAIVFLLLALGAVVAFPLAMSTFGLSALVDTATWLVRWPVLLALVLFGLAVLYRFGPSRNNARWRWISPGSLAGALSWIAGSALLSLYLSYFADYNATYGSLGAAIGLMMWMWLTTIAVLIGAELDSEIDKLRPGAAA